MRRRAPSLRSFLFGLDHAGGMGAAGTRLFLTRFDPSQLFCCLLNMTFPVILETPANSCSSSGGMLAQMLFHWLQIPRQRVLGFAVDPREHLVDPKSKAFGEGHQKSSLPCKHFTRAPNSVLGAETHFGVNSLG